VTNTERFIKDKCLEEAMLRRNVLKIMGLGGLVLTATPSLVKSVFGEENPAPEKEPTLEELAAKWNMPLSEVQRIAAEMKQPVMETLKGYAMPVCHSDYDKEVFQKHLPAKDKKPSLVMFYEDLPESNDTLGVQYSRGFASVFKELSKNFGNKIKFLCYHSNCDEWSKENNHKNIRFFYDIRAPPSTAMYGIFDLLKGETPDRNDGKIKRIDTLRGGVKEIKWALSWINDLGKYWIPTNITEPNYQYVFKTQNTQGPKWTKIQLNT